MTRVITFCMVMLGCLMASDMYAQMNITGTVVDNNSDPVIGANILIKGTTVGTLSEIDGTYSISANTGDIIVFSSVGFGTQEMTVGTESVIDVVLQVGAALDEVVVVAYGTQKKVTVTGAVSSLKGDDLVKSPAIDISNSLAGRLAGLVVIQPSGEPGNDGANVSIRGQNTLGNSSPLIVIDGIPDRDGGFGRLNSSDIESISVLKDASAAIYGARAANGAILVTTKRGKSGKPSISYNFAQGWASPTVIPNMSNAVEYATIMNELPIYKSIPVNEWETAWSSIQSTGAYDSPTPGVGSLSANFSPDAVQRHGDGSDPWGFPDTDWFGDAFRSQAPQQTHSLTMSGGSDKVNYFASLGYLTQDAIYNESATKYNQYSLRTNLDAKINDNITAKFGVMIRREDRNFPTQDANAIFRMLMRGRPTEPEVWPNGLPGPDIENGQNPYVITTNATGYVDNPKDLTQINLGLDIDIPWVEGLTLSLSGAVDRNSEVSKTWETPWSLYFWDRVSYEADGVTPLLEGAVRSSFQDPRLTQESRSVLNTNLTAIASYDTNIGDDHTFNIMAGVTKEKFNGSNFNAFRRNFISPAIDQLFAGGSTQQQTGGSGYERARLGYYGRVNYNFKEKYLAEFIWRYDGSYIFPESGRFGFFPGILLGWNISSEDWFTSSAIDRLKLRASFGQMGNDQVFFDADGDGESELQEYAYLSTYGFGEYPIDNVVQSTLTETLLANPDFTWERANNLNIGVDVTFGNVDLTMEYFNNRRSQILIQETGSTPASSGISALLPPVNAGIVNNRGFELSAIYSKGNNDLRYSFGINGGYAKNKVIFMDEVPGAPEYQLQEGKPIDAFLVYESDGVFRDQAAIEANTLDYSGVTGQLIPGDMKFVDQNGDGVINGDDQIRLEKNATPKLNYGATFNLEYKNFDFSMLLQGAAGASIRVQTESGDIGNFLKYSHDNRWRIDAPSDVHPRLASRGDTYYTGGPYGDNTYFLFSKNYMRLKNLELGYTLSKDLTEKIGLSNVRIYFNALNLLTFSGNDVFDPETEQGNGVYYPQSKVLNTGISVTF